MISIFGTLLVAKNTHIVKLSNFMGPLFEALDIEGVDLLSNTDQPVNEIAKKLGYDDPANFILFLKGYAWVSPEKYRKLV